MAFRRLTLLDWMVERGQITANEYKAGKALALLIEWRAASLHAASSLEVFAIRMQEHAKITGGNLVPHEIKVKDIEAFGDTVNERLRKHACAADEIRRVASLLNRALPERPDLMTLLGQCVISRINRHEIPCGAVEVLCAALYLIKELWRHDILEDLIDEATGLQRTRTAEEHFGPEWVSPGAGRKAEAPRYGNRETRKMAGQSLQTNAA